MTRLAEMRATLAEADDYYSLMIEAGEHPNLDRVGYTSQIKLEHFRQLLDRPDLQVDELAAILRAARSTIWPTHATDAEKAKRALDDLPAQRRPHARVPRPVQTPHPDTPEDWTVLMARFVMTTAN